VCSQLLPREEPSGWCQGGTYALARFGVTSRVAFVLLGMKKGLLTSGCSRPTLSSSGNVSQGTIMGPILRIKDCRGKMRSNCCNGMKAPLSKDWSM